MLDIPAVTPQDLSLWDPKDATIEEMKLQLTGAKMIVAGSLYGNAEYYELFLKLLRVESGEVLSVTKARINKKLGL